MDWLVLGYRFIITCKCPTMIVIWILSSMQRPFIRPCAYSILILLFTIITTAVFISPLLLFHYFHCHKTVTTDKLLRASLFRGAAELTTPLLRLTNILWLPLCRINKLGLLPLKTVAIPYTCGSSGLFSGAVTGEHSFICKSTWIDIVRCKSSILGKPRDAKVAILPSTTRKGTTLSTSAALDSPSVIDKLVSPPHALRACTSA